jgi:hypothetical protein
MSAENLFRQTGTIPDVEELVHVRFDGVIAQL